jgi:hypothetical protein
MTPRHELDQDWALHSEEMPSAMRVAASATMVNRTHRVIRERARSLQARKSALRSLWVPLAVSAGLLIAAVFAMWDVLDQGVLGQYESGPVGLPDASQQIFVLLMWCLLISAAVFAIVLFRRVGSRADNGGHR